MLSGIEALAALERYGTLSEAAPHLRLTQSAVSKRVRALQDMLGFQLLEPQGRRVRLTVQAIEFLDRARPLLAELRDLTHPMSEAPVTQFSLAIADSIASSWGPGVVSRALRRLEGVTLDLHAHRGVLLIENVRLGRYHIGMCTKLQPDNDLICYPLVDEPMVLLNSEFGERFQPDRPLITIESQALTWRAIEPQLHAHHPDLLRNRITSVESFGAAVQMVKAGFGNGLVPLGLALEMDIRNYRELPGVKRRVSLIVRKTINQLSQFKLLREQIKEAVAAKFSAHLSA